MLTDFIQLFSVLTLSSSVTDDSPGETVMALFSLLTLLSSVTDDSPGDTVMALIIIEDSTVTDFLTVGTVLILTGVVEVFVLQVNIFWLLV